MCLAFGFSVLDCKRSPAVRTPDAVLDVLGHPVGFSQEGWSAILSVLCVGIRLFQRMTWRLAFRDKPKLGGLFIDQVPHGIAAVSP